jgi:hypothetical protein
MLSAPDRRPHRIEFRQTARPARESAIPSIALRTATIATAKGDFLSGGMARLREKADGWTAVLSGLNQPGILASLYFGSGLRDVILRLDDGRRAKARITSTRFAGGERICEIVGVESLA